MDGANSEHPPDFTPHSDHLATSVLRSLSRTYHDQFSLGAIRAGLLGLITFGLVPLWALRRKFRNYVTLERQQLWHLGEWLRNRRGGEPAIAVANAVNRIRTRRWISLLVTLALIVIAVSIINMARGSQSGLQAVIDRTYRFAQTARGEDFFLTWNLVLGAGYALHFVQVRLHVADLLLFTGRFNRLAARENVAAIDLPAGSIGMTIAWAAVGVVLTLMGALWAIPMALAGASQRGYINATSPALRMQLAERMREMLKQNRPAVSVPSYTIHGRRCANNLCRAPLPGAAEFCPRCGSRVSAGVLTEVA